MPRKQPQPFYRKSTQSWYVQINGKQIALGKDRDKAFEQYYSMMLGRQAIPVDIRVQEVLGMYLSWCQGHRALLTYQWYKNHLKSFREHVGPTLTLANLKPYHVEAWLDACYSKMSSTHKNGAVRAVMRAMNWLVKGGHIPANPIVNVERPAYEPREVYIEPNQWIKALASVRERDPFRDFLLFLRLTGCRPQEARHIEAKHFDRFARTVIFPVKESKGKKYKRVIPLHKEAVVIVARLALKNPSGKIFLNKRGKPWSKNVLASRFQKMRAKLGFPFFAYAIRHTYVTDALLRGIDPTTVATIVGHKDASMVLKVYQHMNLNTGHVADAVDRAVAELPPPKKQPPNDQQASA